MDQYLLKIVIIGNSRVGKTSLLTRYIDDRFTENHNTTIGVDFMVKDLVQEGKIAKLQLWDTAGQERFRNIVSLFYRGAEGLVVVFDVTDGESFKKVPFWLEEAMTQNEADCIAILVGNKTDMPNRAVDKETAQAFADQHGIQYIETSAKSAANVHELFDAMAEAILKRKTELGLPPLVTNSMEQSFIIQSTDVSQASWCGWGSGYCSSE
ncbi:unnamed protein product [Candidula unifasciata]|uniref:Uncharacterized protein n=1 Tax=Candidula unifasciata TaxID=100452 RepID=A0A8S4A0E3_9EUPU|nr:unnamed protein product [Candidula unifasciata]